MGHARVEERITAPVRIEPIAQVGPRMDRMDCLVSDQLFEQRGRRLPSDALELQEPDVEPRGKPGLQLSVQRREFLVFIQKTQQVRPQVNQELRALRQCIELGHDAHARRTQRRAQRGLRIPLARRPERRAIGFIGRGDGLRIGSELAGDHAQELMPPGITQPGIGLAKLGGTLTCGELAAERGCAVP